jgi:hypothetical protein
MSAIPSPPSYDPAPAAEKPPEWDDDWAKWLLGRYALVGITTMEADRETVRSQAQYHGRIVEVDRSGVTIACEGRWRGQKVTVPPDKMAFEPAAPRQYRLRSTGEVIDDPDILTSWTIFDPAPSETDRANDS